MLLVANEFSDEGETIYLFHKRLNLLLTESLHNIKPLVRKPPHIFVPLFILQLSLTMVNRLVNFYSRAHQQRHIFGADQPTPFIACHLNILSIRFVHLDHLNTFR